MKRCCWLTCFNTCCSLTCRQRKLKCDETKPVCGQCIKASRECVPSSGIVFRHQHNASMNGDDSGDENSLKGFYSYKNTFEDDAIWLDIPKNGRWLCWEIALLSNMICSHVHQHNKPLFGPHNTRSRDHVRYVTRFACTFSTSICQHMATFKQLSLFG